MTSEKLDELQKLCDAATLNKHSRIEILHHEGHFYKPPSTEQIEANRKLCQIARTAVPEMILEYKKLEERLREAEEALRFYMKEAESDIGAKAYFLNRSQIDILDRSKRAKAYFEKHGDLK